MILITGGTGFIGSHLIQELTDSGKSVRAIKRSQSIIPSNLQDNKLIEWVEADLIDYFSLEDAFKDISEVYHCAALVSYEAADKKQLMKVNAQGTAHIVNLCLLHQARLLYLSSVAALGNSEKGQAISEKTQWEWDKNKNNYSISKYEAEREVWRGMSEGLNAVILNPSIVIGPFKEYAESGKIFELLEKGFLFYPSGSTGFVDVDDLINIMKTLMNRTDISEERFIINAVNISYKKFFTKYAKITGKKAPKYLAGKNRLAIAWRFLKALKILGIKKSGITKEVAQASSKKSHYSNKKISTLLQYSFKPFNKSLTEIHASFKNTTE